MTKPEREAQLLEDVASNLRAEGYDVFIRPHQGILPAILAGATPDAIAFGKPKNLAILVVDAASARVRVEQLTSRLKASREWDLRVYSIKPSEGEKAIASASARAIAATLTTVKELHSQGLTGPALLMAWATFESLARNREPSLFARPQTPGRLIEIFASEGRVTPTEADTLRRLATVRNRLVHGDLELPVDGADLQKFIEVLEMIVKPESVAAA